MDNRRCADCGSNDFPLRNLTTGYLVCRDGRACRERQDQAVRVARWTALADSYGGHGRHKPTDLVEYPMAIMSLLSDAQALFPDDSQDQNDRINAAKMMLSRMIDAARKAEREAAAVTK